MIAVLDISVVIIINLNETNQGPKHNLFHLLKQFHRQIFFYCALRSMLWTK